MTAMTLDLPDTTLEDLKALHPRARCTPRLGLERVLPTKTTQTSGIMVWHWTLAEPLLMDGALIEIGDRAWKAQPLDPAGGAKHGTRGRLTLRAHLRDFR
jgi:hypothetical protein